MNGAKTLIGLASLRSRPKTLSILGIGSYEPDDCRGWAEHISDEQLPLKRIIGDWRDYYLKVRNGETIGSLKTWDDNDREFYKAQQLMTAPFFELGQHYNFDDTTVLPYIDFAAAEGEAKGYRGGGYSEIHIRSIHPSHHNFWDCSQHGASSPKILLS